MFLPSAVLLVLEWENFSPRQQGEKRKANWRGRNRRETGKTGKTGKKPAPIPGTVRSRNQPSALAAQRLKAVMNAQFKPRPLLNKPERWLRSCIGTVLLEESAAPRAPWGR